MSISTVRHLIDLVHELEDSDIESDFGFGVYPHEIHRHRRLLPRLPLMLQPRSKPYPYGISKKPRTNAIAKSEYPVVGKDGFQMCIDVGQFKPSEISVKTVDHTVIIEGKHEEREDDHGIISRHFVRKYTLPKDYDPNDVVSTLSSDGILSVKAPPTAKPSSNERIVQIQQTGPAHLSIKENAEPAAASDSAAQDGNATNGEKSNENMED